MRKKLPVVQSENILIIYDPLKPREKSTHHSDISDFIFKAAEGKFSQIYVPKPYLEWRTSNQVVNRILASISLIVHAVILGCKISVGSRKKKVTILNPNENPVSLLSLLLLRKIVRGNWRIVSRFICTRDSVLTDLNSRTTRLFYKLLSTYSSSLDKYAAETLEYSDFLMAAIKSEVLHVPYPPIDRPYELKTSRHNLTTFCVLGSARQDKGFSQLPELVHQIESQVNGAQFYIQGAEIPWVGYDAVANYLQAKKNVVFLEGYLSTEEMFEILVKSDVVLLPYDRETYRYRGSALARRGMYLGKGIATTEGTTMSRDAIRFGFNRSLKNLLVCNQSIKSSSTILQLRNDAIRTWENFLL